MQIDVIKEQFTTKTFGNTHYTDILITVVYLPCLFGTPIYRIVRQIDSLVPIRRGRRTKQTLYDTLTEEPRKYLTREEKDTIRENCLKAIQTNQKINTVMKHICEDSGTCVICNEEQSNTTMTVGNNICNACIGYVKFVLTNLRCGRMTWHRLLDEGRIAWDKQAQDWIIIFYPEEVNAVHPDDLRLLYKGKFDEIYLGEELCSILQTNNGGKD